MFFINLFKKFINLFKRNKSPCDCSEYIKRIEELESKLSKEEDSPKVTGRQKLEEFATRMRENPTYYERKFYDYLVAHRVNFEFQKILYCSKSYIADFFLVDYKVIVEIDGEYHYTEEQQEKDWYRTLDIFHTYGYKTLRISNNQIYSDKFEDKLINFLKANK